MTYDSCSSCLLMSNLELAKCPVWALNQHNITKCVSDSDVREGMWGVLYAIFSIDFLCSRCLYKPWTMYPYANQSPNNLRHWGHQSWGWTRFTRGWSSSRNEYSRASLQSISIPLKCSFWLISFAKKAATCYIKWKFVSWTFQTASPFISLRLTWPIALSPSISSNYWK